MVKYIRTKLGVHSGTFGYIRLGWGFPGVYENLANRRRRSSCLGTFAACTHPFYKTKKGVMGFKRWGQSPTLQAFRNLPGDGLSCTSSPPVIHHPKQAGNCVSPRNLKTLRFYFPALVSFPVPENNSADFRSTHPRIVRIHESVCLKARTAQEWRDYLLERSAHLANDVSAHWGCPAGPLLSRRDEAAWMARTCSSCRSSSCAPRSSSHPWQLAKSLLPGMSSCATEDWQVVRRKS